jgi:hypothetical protein
MLVGLYADPNPVSVQTSDKIFQIKQKLLFCRGATAQHPRFPVYRYVMLKTISGFHLIPTISASRDDPILAVPAFNKLGRPEIFSRSFATAAVFRVGCDWYSLSIRRSSVNATGRSEEWVSYPKR